MLNPAPAARRAVSDEGKKQRSGQREERRETKVSKGKKANVRKDKSGDHCVTID